MPTELPLAGQSPGTPKAPRAGLGRNPGVHHWSGKRQVRYVARPKFRAMRVTRPAGSGEGARVTERVCRLVGEDGRPPSLIRASCTTTRRYDMQIKFGDMRDRST